MHLGPLDTARNDLLKAITTVYERLEGRQDAQAQLIAGHILDYGVAIRQNKPRDQAEPALVALEGSITLPPAKGTVFAKVERIRVIGHRDPESIEDPVFQAAYSAIKKEKEAKAALEKSVQDMRGLHSHYFTLKEAMGKEKKL